MASQRLSPDAPVVVIIGAGFGGIIAATSLKEKLGFHNFIIFEQGSDVGGTWNNNRYPGAGSDVTVHFYCISTDLTPEWENTNEFQPSLLNYIKDVVRKHEIGPHVVLNRKVVDATWQSSSQTYAVTTEDTKTGERSTITANIVISGNGGLNVPKMPLIPGLDSFKGRLMHSARWDNSLDLRGKRVALIGNGSTGSQIMSNIPQIDGIQITQFYRTKNWNLPSIGMPVPPLMKWTLRHVPFALRLHRWLMFWIFESTYWLIFKSALTRAPLIKLATSFMRKSAPEKYHDVLIPEFPVGCRRIVYDTGYLKALHRPNVEIRRNAISEIYSEGIVTPDGEKLPFDVIICATGFVADKFPYDVRGRGPHTIQEYYDKTGGPNAYLGMSIPGFPNFCTLVGPNIATGYTSVIFFIEAQMQYAVQLIKPILDGAASTFEITQEANDRYNDKLQANLNDSVYTFCGSWYRVNGTGRNTSIFPFSQITFWWWCQSVNWSHYKITGLKGGIEGLNKWSSLKSFTIAAGMGIAALSVALLLSN